MLGLAKTQEKYCFIEFYYLCITAEKRANIGALPMDVIDEMRRLSLSKCFPSCYVINYIYEIAIFHSIEPRNM